MPFNLEKRCIEARKEAIEYGISLCSGLEPASATEVDKLEKRKVSGEEMDELEPCAICQEGMFLGDEATRMPCSHVFHATCIESCLQRDYICPLCRHKPAQKKVQRQLQVRIEAQAKYLQSVLIKAQETLAGYSSSNLGIEFARPELYGAASMANTSCLTFSFPELTQVDEEEEEGFLEHKRSVNRGIRQTRSSVDRSLSSSESSGANADADSQCFMMRRSIEIQLMKIKPEEATKRKKRRSDDAVSVEQPIWRSRL
ncbi:unnamed protein product [Thlaspi arvense]|uniref:RING-type domain-containing protein n=1 Tax=Thlaspi arvense TaxID=13288 RepID=A0AAU9R4Z3_THLAR|nr:unnamed protein product [Thlaspi arvense]